MIYVCPLSKLDETVALSGARRLVSLLTDPAMMTRPAVIAAENHLLLTMHDISEPLEGMLAPGEEHVGSLIDFALQWDRASPLAINCLAGISRSTASAYIVASALCPGINERELADRLRKASPSATPNARLIALADDILGRGGRMVDAIKGIGRGSDAYEGTPFRLDIDS
ncbi:protein tyrosine phosphatase [Pseudaminobacter arsenicus]|uniref:Protein tyrosine phosphatase n=1 Tax=Borborobacter arsenicus TaxID=1851146 RepID=A0A432V9C6_9HYPH|nr:tyrosine phosphatase family protein [Pseudaminobacter arsenicus]RUM98744.1 protein tyrosine phosphatase [Pseudaminobacter arsenicus]